jgi:C-terminal processing protease CtpA/Prc
MIVGADTASAAEVFAIPMHRLPQVTVIGERTAGILSDILQKPLPNGWFVGLSNEVYLDAQGVSFEGTGLTPDIEVPVFRLEDIEAGIDPALEQALSM